MAIPLGPGMSDGTGPQIVRTADDQVLLFGYKMATGFIYVYRAQGLPNTSADFSTLATLTLPNGSVTTLNTLYDGGGYVYMPVLTTNGTVLVYVFDLAAGSFKAPLTLATNARSILGNTLYAGTVGLSSAFDQFGTLQLAFWTNADRIAHCAVTVNAAQNTASTCTQTLVDSAGSANHPNVAVSPVDNSVTVAWMSEAGTYAILTRRRAADGTWSAITQASTSEPFHNRASGGNEVNVDQGPHVIIDTANVRHLVYAQHFDSTGDYGRIHYVVDTGSGWQDTALANYSHVPTLALGRSGELIILGHGSNRNGASSSECLTNLNFCYMARSTSGVWGSMQPIAVATGAQSFDGNSSVKWSVVGWNRPEVVEFAFFSILNGDYYVPTLYYGRLP